MSLVHHETEARFDAALAHARSLGGKTLESWENAWARLDRWFGQEVECHVFADHAPWSFYFEIRDGDRTCMNGGVIYYQGRESGSAGPQFSVTTSGLDHPRWEVHT
jgi:hypothetical protein